MKRFRIICLFVIAAFVLSGCVSLPVKNEAVVPDRKFLQEKGAIFILDSAEVKVSGSGSHETTVHEKILVTGESGKRFGDLQIPYDSERQKVEVVFARSVSPEGKTTPVDPLNIRNVTPAELSQYTVLYPGIKSITISFPEVEIGTTIEYSYRMETFKPLIPGRFWDDFSFQSTEPFVLSVYRLIVPKNFHLNFFEYGVEPPEKKDLGRNMLYVWEKKNVDSVIPETEMPDMDEIVPRVLVTSYDNWDEIEKWFSALSADALEVTPELAKSTASIIKDAKTDNEKIRMIYHFICTNVRYVGLEIGIHGFKPHKASDVLELRYGDCKDKAALMVTMLKAAGIKGCVTLINADRLIDVKVPSPGQFDHAIVGIPGKESFLFLDPTSEVYSYPDLPSVDQNKTVLVSDGGKTVLAKTPFFPPEDNIKLRETEAVLDSNGNLKASVKIKPSGIFEAGVRAAFRYLKDEEQKRSLSGELNRLISGTKLLDLKLTGLYDLNQPVEETYVMENGRYGIKIAGRMLFSPGIIERLSDTALVSLEKRNYPLRFTSTRFYDDVIHFTLPENYEIDACPEDVSLNNRFGSYELKFTKGKGGLEYRRIFKLSVFEIPPEDYPAFKEFYQSVAYYDKLPVILKKNN